MKVTEDGNETGTPSQLQLEQYARTLGFHLRLLGALIPEMTKFASNGPEILTNACLDSFLTHARLLIEFVEGRQPERTPPTHHKNDLQPKTFGLPDWSIGVSLDRYLELIDQRHSHLTLVRAKDSVGWHWPVDQMANRIIAAYEDFADRLRDDGFAECADLISAGAREALTSMKQASLG